MSFATLFPARRSGRSETRCRRGSGAAARRWVPRRRRRVARCSSPSSTVDLAEQLVTLEDDKEGAAAGALFDMDANRRAWHAEHRPEQLLERTAAVSGAETRDVVNWLILQLDATPAVEDRIAERHSLRHVQALEELVDERCRHVRRQRAAVGERNAQVVRANADPVDERARREQPKRQVGQT